MLWGSRAMKMYSSPMRILGTRLRTTKKPSTDNTASTGKSTPQNQPERRPLPRASRERVR